MSRRCDQPLGLARIVDYLAGDADTDADAVEEHLMGCAACAAEAEQLERITRALAATLPPVVSAAQVDALRARGLVVDENAFAPGQRTEVVFRPGVDLLIHHLGGLALADAERVQVTVTVESTGQLLADDLFAPFERASGEVLIACQRHFAVMPPDIQFHVRVHAAGSAPVVATYRIPHVFG